MIAEERENGKLVQQLWRVQSTETRFVLLTRRRKHIETAELHAQPSSRRQDGKLHMFAKKFSAI